MKVNFSGLDRLNIPSMLDIAIPESKGPEMVIISEIADKVMMTTDEWNEYGIINDPRGFGWHPVKILKETEYELNEHQVKILIDAATKLDEISRVTRQNASTWTKLKQLKLTK